MYNLWFAKVLGIFFSVGSLSIEILLSLLGSQGTRGWLPTTYPIVLWISLELFSSVWNMESVGWNSSQARRIVYSWIWIIHILVSPRHINIQLLMYVFSISDKIITLKLHWNIKCNWRVTWWENSGFKPHLKLILDRRENLGSVLHIAY